MANTAGHRNDNGGLGFDGKNSGKGLLLAIALSMIIIGCAFILIAAVPMDYSFTVGSVSTTVTLRLLTTFTESCPG